MVNGMEEFFRLYNEYKNNANLKVEVTCSQADGCKIYTNYSGYIEITKNNNVELAFKEATKNLTKSIATVAYIFADNN